MALSTCRGTCGLDFTSLSAFDKHQSMRVTGMQAAVTCHDPASVGLVQKDKGWGFPAVETPIEYNGAPAQPVSLDRECVDCHKTFQRPARRGRPPVRCPECKLQLDLDKDYVAPENY